MIDVNGIEKIVDENKEEAVNFLAKMIQTPSVTGEEKAVGAVCKEMMEGMGLEVKVYEKAPGRPNLVAEWNGNETGKRFVFNGHYDVFPPVSDKPGRYGPWSGEIVDGKMYGRGTVDMKSGLCATIMAV